MKKRDAVKFPLMPGAVLAIAAISLCSSFVSAQPTTRDAPPSLIPQQAIVLTGITQGRGEFEAYFENIAASGALPVKVVIGDSLAGGKIADIQVDRIAYLSGGKTTWVLVGQNLAGDSVLQLRKEPRP